MITTVAGWSLALTIATLFGGFALMVVKKLTTSETQITFIKETQTLILKKIDGLAGQGQDIAVLQNDVKTLYKLTERNSDNANQRTEKRGGS
ncbi:MAG: hypothetical protein JKY52_08285 [Flavobacteriales bacterium]|nr:hypothetical protein [Flavobacteriales bacterium]